MEVTVEILEGTLRNLVKESQFKGYSFKLGKDLLSLNDSGINNPNYFDAIREEDTPWNVFILQNEDNQAIFATFEIEAINSVNEGEFDDYVRIKAATAIQERKT